MIILEGPDNAGKSTLGAYLSKELRAPLIHSEKPDPNWTQLECLEHSTRQLRPQGAILDRIYALSECVYGPICRGASALGDKHPEALLDLYHRPYLVVYCRPKMETILRNNGRDQMPGVLESHRDIVEAYDVLMEEVSRFAHCRVIRYDWQNVGDTERVLFQARKHFTTYRSSLYSSVFMGEGK